MTQDEKWKRQEKRNKEHKRERTGKEKEK